jgi:hypothetical protein
MTLFFCFGTYVKYLDAELNYTIVVEVIIETGVIKIRELVLERNQKIMI